MIELCITATGKGYSPQSKWQMMYDESHSFATMAEAMAWIKERYGKAKRSPMYIDTKDGKSKRIGYVIGFRNADWSHVPVTKWLQQDWVEFRECNQLELAA